MIAEETVAELRHLATVVAPELRDWPLYVLDAAELPPGYNGGDCLGWAARPFYRDPNLVDAIGDKFEGDGNVIALDVAAIGAAAKPGRFDECQRTIFLHEVAHLLPLSTPTVVLEGTPLERKWCRERFQAEVEVLGATPLHNDETHNLEFRRRALHMVVRAAIAGYDVRLDGLFGFATPFEQQSVFSSLPVMLTEALKMRRMTFDAISLEPPPPDLVEIFEDDCYKVQYCWSQPDE